MRTEREQRQRTDDRLHTAGGHGTFSLVWCLEDTAIGRKSQASVLEQAELREALGCGQQCVLG